MNRDDFLKLATSGSNAEYQPVALLLVNGYACIGHYNASVNEGLTDTCVLVNNTLIDLREQSAASSRPVLSDFGDFLEEVVAGHTQSTGEPASYRERYAKPIPLTAIPYPQITVVYPVAQISRLLQRCESKGSRFPAFFDLGRSEIVRLLAMRLW